MNGRHRDRFRNRIVLLRFKLIIIELKNQQNKQDKDRRFHFKIRINTKKKMNNSELSVADLRGGRQVSCLEAKISVESASFECQALEPPFR